MPLIRTLTALLLWSLLLVSVGRGQALSTPELNRQMAELGAKRTVGLASSKDEYQSYYGTGALISADGYILTSTTVVPAGAKEVKVEFDGGKIQDAVLVETIDSLELSLVKVDGQGLPFFPVAKELPTVGGRAYTYSNANNLIRLGGRPAFSSGVISGVYKVTNQGGESVYEGNAIETSAAINPGSDGGPIINQYGQLCAIVSLNFSPVRWQGVGAPVHEQLPQLAAFKAGKVKVSYDPLVTPLANDGLSSLAKHASEVAKFFVGVDVRRKFKPEVLPRAPWDDFRKTIPEWDDKTTEERSRFQLEYYEAARLMEANQLLRRPGGLCTGVVVSADGLIATSLFNVGEDAVFKEKKTGQPRAIQFKGTVAEVAANVDKELTLDNNEIEKIVVKLPDGRELPAKLAGRHLPLGVALLKVEATDLPFFDITKVAEPKLGMQVGLVGYVGGDLTKFTLNPGIVSSPTRDRGQRFQTDALLNYGNSGGVVISSDGQFLGIAGAPIRPRTVIGRVFNREQLGQWLSAPNSGVSMIARADKFAAVLNDLKSGKSIERPPGAVLGVVFDPNKALGEAVIIGAVTPGSAAEKAGIKAGDRILSFDGEVLASWKELTEHVSRHEPGDKVALKVRRKDIVRHLLINGEKVGTGAELDALLKKLKSGDKVTGEMVQGDEAELSVVLGQ